MNKSIFTTHRTTKINNIVIWKNKNWKQNINIGKSNNQKFTAIPHTTFIEKLQSKSEEVWVLCHTVEESYTSKCSFLDWEIPKKYESYKGRRVKRWLFKTENSKIVNADINGAANILVKYFVVKTKVSTEFLNSFRERVSKGFMNNPLRVKLFYAQETSTL